MTLGSCWCADQPRAPSRRQDSAQLIDRRVCSCMQKIELAKDKVLDERLRQRMTGQLKAVVAESPFDAKPVVSRSGPKPLLVPRPPRLPLTSPVALAVALRRSARRLG